MANISMECVEKMFTKFFAPMELQITMMAAAIKRLEQKIDCGNGWTGTSPNSSAADQHHTIHKGTTSTTNCGPQRVIKKDTLTPSVLTKPTVLTAMTTRAKRAIARQQQRDIKSGDSIPTSLSTMVVSNPHIASNTQTTQSFADVVNNASPTTHVDNTPELAAYDSLTSQNTPWQIVSKRKDRRSNTRQVVHGNGASDNELIAVERGRRLHVCFLKPDTTTDTLKSYMNKKNPSSEYHIGKLTLKHQHYASFAVTVPCSKYDYFMSADNWPRQVEVSPWFRWGDGRAMRTSAQTNQGATTGGADCAQVRGRRRRPVPRASAPTGTSVAAITDVDQQ